MLIRVPPIHSVVLLKRHPAHNTTLCSLESHHLLKWTSPMVMALMTTVSSSSLVCHLYTVVTRMCIFVTV